MLGLKFLRAFMNDILILTHSTWDNHLIKLNLVFERIQNAGLKVNAIKSFFGKNVEYLGYWITRQGIQPLHKKVEAFKNLLPPTTKRRLRHFIGLINYYCDMRTKITYSSAACFFDFQNAKGSWGVVKQTALDNIKKDGS